jgi:hypothetical protein
MIEDLKADSARWDTERRTQSSRNSSGGSFASRDASGYSARLSSNSPLVQYRMSETHQSRQHHGPTNDNPYNNQDPYARESAYDGPRYPGTGAPGYNGAAGGFSQPYGGSGGGSYGYQQHPPPQQSPQPDPRYAGGYAQPMDRGSYATNQDGPSSYVHTGANMPPMPRGYTPTEAYPPSRGMSSSVANPSQPIYASVPPTQQSYPAPTSPFNYPGQVTSMHAPEGFSRASPAGQSNQQSPSGFPGQTQQFAETPNPRASVPPQSASSSSTTAAKRRSDRDDDRHGSSDRHSRQPRR